MYLGALIDSKGKPGHEVLKKIRDSCRIFKILLRIWKYIRISTKRKIDIYYACVVSKLMYSLCILCLIEK